MKLPDLPMPVLISLGVIIVFLGLFAGLYGYVHGQLEQTRTNEQQLTADLNSTRGAIDQARVDYDFVNENATRYEKVLESDEIIPHTRRAAIRQLQQTALDAGLTGLTYGFKPAEAGAGGVRGRDVFGNYRLSIEDVDLSINAHYDGQVYDFIERLVEDVPGAAVVSTLDMHRAERISFDMLNSISRGLPSGLVMAEMTFSWRTAQLVKEGGTP